MKGVGGGEMRGRGVLGVILAAGVALIGLLYAQSSASGQGTKNQNIQEYITGRNNTVLFLTDDHNGLSNVHVATTFALLEKHPHIQIHYASFPKMAQEVSRVYAAARKKQSAAKPVKFHELPEIGWVDALKESRHASATPVMGPGRKGLSKLLEHIAPLMSPWPEDMHLRLFQHISNLIEQVDPAVIVLDQLLGPALDAAATLNRTRAIISPNAISDSFVTLQPRAAALWKYPALTSGFPYPLPWHKIPENIYILLHLIYGIVTSPELKAKKAFLARHGVRNPLQPDKHKDLAVPWIAASFPEGGPRLDYVPPNVVQCGPIALDVAPAHTQDPKLAAWLKRGPTMLVNLGKSVKYLEDRAEAMIQAFITVLDQSTDVQILWKYQMAGKYDLERLLVPAQKHIKSGRLRIETWLNADPVSLLSTGDIAVSVHHGGANCFYETTLSGTRQVILPLWFDLYAYARIAEDLQIGVWPGQKHAPEWTAESLSAGFLKALAGDTSDALRQNAKRIGEIARSYGGRDTAARKIADMAARGYV